MNHMNKVAQGLIDMAKQIESLDTANADLRARLEAATKDRDNELADNTGLALKCAALAEECDNFKALASRETSRRLDAEKARDEQAEAVRVMAKAVYEVAWQVTDEGQDVFSYVSPAVMNNATAAAAVKEASGG